MIPARVKDITGRRFGKLVVRTLAEISTKRQEAVWECVCDCGRVKNISGASLKQGNTQSCGCRNQPTVTAVVNAILLMYRKGAAARGLSWRLSRRKAEALLQSPCFYCHTVGGNKRKWKGKPPFHYNGIDRVDNQKGYTPHNCVSCCGTCNWMKGALSAEEFLDKVNQIHEAQTT